MRRRKEPDATGLRRAGPFAAPADVAPDPALPDLPADQLDPDDQTRDALSGQVEELDKPECLCKVSVRCPHGFGAPINGAGETVLWLIAAVPGAPDAAGEKGRVGLADLRERVSLVEYATASGLRQLRRRGPTPPALPVPGLPRFGLFDDSGESGWWLLRGDVQDGVWTWDGKFAPDHGLDPAFWRMLQESLAAEQFADRPAPPPGQAVTHAARRGELRARHDAEFGLWHAADQYRPADPDAHAHVAEEARQFAKGGSLVVQEGQKPARERAWQEAVDEVKADVYATLELRKRKGTPCSQGKPDAPPSA